MKIKSFVFGHSRRGLPVIGHHFGSEGPQALILGGVHGDEIEGVIAAYGLLKAFSADFSYKIRATLVPTFNVDGVLARERKNSAGVDLNRNLATKDWTSEVAEERYYPGTAANSEPENQSLVSHLEATPPAVVISLHSWKPLLNTNGDCLAEAEVIAEHTGYEIKDSIGYPTPGCLGTYCGLERDIPTLTYEIEKGLAPDRILSDHVPAILKALKQTEKRS